MTLRGEIMRFSTMVALLAKARFLSRFSVLLSMTGREIRARFPLVSPGSVIAEKFRSNVQRNTQILEEELGQATGPFSPLPAYGERWERKQITATSST